VKVSRKFEVEKKTCRNAPPPEDSVSHLPNAPPPKHSPSHYCLRSVDRASRLGSELSLAIARAVARQVEGDWPSDWQAWVSLCVSVEEHFGRILDLTTFCIFDDVSR
jgi:hypothetical protein